MGSLSLQNPSALLWFLPFAGIILALYLLKMKRRDITVPATFLWPERVEEIRANSLFQKLRPSWLLFLQLLALLFIVVALSKPKIRQSGLMGEVTVFVLDTSASMSATDVKPSRFGEAKRLAQEAIRSAKPTDRIAIIEAGPTPRVISPLSTDPAKQLLALDALEPTDAESQVGEALRLAAALVGSIDGARIVLLSDGDFEKVSNFTRGKAALVYKCIGTMDDNLSINALGTAETSAGRQIYCGVRNNSSKPNGGSLSIYADGKVIDSIKFPTIGPKGLWGRTIAAPAGAHVFEAKIDAPDLLKSDNYAVCVADPNASLRVLLVTKGNLFLERALTLDPRVTLDKSLEVPTSERQNGTSIAGSYDIVIFDGMTEQPVKARGVLTFGTPGTPSPVKAKGTASKPRYVSEEPNPILKSVGLESVFVDSQTVVEPKSNGEVLARSSAGPLIVVSQEASKRQIFVGFNPLESDFPLQIGFPIFVSNALDYLAGGSSNSTLSIRTGQPFSIPLATNVTLTTPAGENVALKSNGATIVIRETKKVGTYTLRADGKNRTIYASLRSDRASNIQPERELDLGGGTVKTTQSPLSFADFWRPLVALCLCVLGVEWWLFARKS